MAYPFYCTHCGRQLNQEEVLMDMQSILTGDTKVRLNLLKFRLTMKEFMALYNGGVPVGEGFRNCKLSFEQLLSFMANENNLADPAIKSLTIQELKEYLGKGDLGSVQVESSTAPKKKETSPEALIFAGLDDEEEDDPFFAGQEESASAEPIKPAEPKVPAAIQALLDSGRKAIDETKSTLSAGSNEAVDDILFVKIRLGDDLEKLYSLFAEKNSITFGLHLFEEDDNDGKKLLTAYRLRMHKSEFKIDGRICPHCETAVFEHAGTARHQSVAFIGYRGSGKTSTILALTHYAENAIQGALDPEIWGTEPGIGSILQAQTIGKCERLIQDLERYPHGIAPPRTPAGKRDDAYSVTLRIKSRANGGKWHLLTLVDLPGELCKFPSPETGELRARIDANNILQQFQIALSADAYVVCFDTAAKNDNETVAQKVANTCTWADDFQILRANANRHKGDSSLSVPMMVLFTKCTDLEGDSPVLTPKSAPGFTPLKDVYMFRKEQLVIEDNPVYRQVMEQFRHAGNLNQAFHAVLRSSPFGGPAPSEDDLKKDPSLKTVPTSPRNIDKLMRWLLCVSGCIPTEAEYRKFPDEPSAHTTREGYCIQPPQNRSRNPIDDDEALARCALFENPGCHDIKRVDNLGSPAILRLEYKFWKPNSNAEENNNG